jgi:hypothetical protein
MTSQRKTVPIVCPNPDCRARFSATLTDRPPEWEVTCVECGEPFGTVQGQHVYYLFPPSDMGRSER